MELTTPAKFDVYDEPNNVAHRWERYVKSVKIYLAAKGINAAQRQRAILLHCAGSDVQDMAENNITDTGTDFTTLVGKLTEYFAAQNNIVFERYQFRLRTQLEGERVDSWYTRLRIEAQMCEYEGQTDSIIRDQIVACCSSTKLRCKLLETPNISLQDTLKTARSLEAAEMHAKAIENTETNVNNSKNNFEELSALRQHRKSSNKRRTEPDWVERARKQEQQHPRKPPTPATCYRCGEPGHRTCNKARGKTCSRCGKQNHFAKACRSTQDPPTRTDEINELHKREEDVVEPSRYGTQDSSEEEIFTLQALHPDSSDNSARLSLQLNGFPTTLLIDSGASVNVLPLLVYQKVKQQGSKPEPTSTRIYPYGSTHPLEVLGKCHITVDAYGKRALVEFVIVNHKGTAILGRDTSLAMGVLHVGPLNHHTHGLYRLTSELENPANAIHADAPASKAVSPTRFKVTPTTEPNPIPEPRSLPAALRLNTILSDYRQVFEGLGRVKGVEVEIHMKKGTIPVVHPPSRVPVHLREALNKELDIQESLGIIEPVEGPTPWVSRIVVVPKSTPGEVRVTQDWRDVNAHVEREIQPIPTFEEATDEMDGSTVWSKLDMFKSFHQIALHPNSRKYATFSTPRGLRRCTTLVMGFTNASEILQRVMSMVLSGIPGVRWIHDDITIYGHTVREHNERLATCLHRLQEYNITLNKEKCVFGVDKITFMAMQLSSKGIQPSHQKVDAIKYFKAPSNVSEVKSFLGLINFVSRFVPNLATKAEPLRRLTRSGRKWIWGPDQQESFQALKNSISSASCLAFFDKNRKTELRVDASPVGLGAILCQIQADGSSRPVAYASRSLSDVERRYSQIEREALGVKFGCLKFDHYLSGDPNFTIITDHKPLLGMYKPGSRPPPRIQRWALRIQHLNFRLRYEPGPKNAADVLSRQPTSPRVHVNPSEHADTRMINAITTSSLPRACTVEQVKSATATDTTLQAVIESLQSGTWKADLGPFRPHRNEFSFSDGVLLRNDRIVIPQSLRQRILILAHQGHQGIAKTKARLRTKV